MRPRRVSRVNVAQPGRIGTQNVMRRNSRTDGTAISLSSPTLTRPAISAASTAPRPPGVGAAWPMAEPAR